MQVNNKWVRDVLRIIPLIIIAGIILLPDPGSLKVVLFSIGVMALSFSFAHIMRRIFFPYLDLKTLIIKGQTGTNASAIMFVSIVILLCVMIIAPLILLR